jgi:hypothetical protein
LGAAYPVIAAQQNAAYTPLKSLFPYSALAYGAACLVAASVAWHVRPTWFIEAPAAGLLLAALSATIALGCAGQWYVHHRFPNHDFVQHNEVGGFIIGVTGALYAVILGFLIVVGWQHFADARQLVASEAALAADVWHAADGLPATARTRVRSDALKYSLLMTQNEWPQMRAGNFDTDADFVVMDAMTAAGRLIPANLKESNAQNATLQALGSLHDVRQRRLADNEGGLSAFEWLVLAIGAACVISMCWIFGIANATIHLFMTATVTVSITSALVLLFELQYPFRTDLRITPTSWSATINHIHLMQDDPRSSMKM